MFRGGSAGDCAGAEDEVHRCIGKEVVQRCRGGAVQRCRDSEVQWCRCRGAEVLSLC